MDEKLEDLINKSSIPEQLLTYFKESNRAKEYINESMLEDIEELFIFYKALFHFDETEFSAFTISTLKRGSEATAYYYYLKKVLDSNLELISKDETFIKNKEIFNLRSEEINSDEIFMNISKEFSQDVENYYQNDFKKTEVLETYSLLGKLELIYHITGNDYYIKMHNGGKNIINNRIKEYNLQRYIIID